LRKTKDELEALKKKFNVNELWSWSKYNCYKNSIYEYFLKYILHIKEDRKDGIYSVSGSVCHDILERFYGKKIKYEDMLGEYENSLFDFNMADLKYDRTNEEKNTAIAEKYENCLKYFFKNHQIIDKKVDIERFITLKVGSQVFQGYIDFLFKDGNCFVITDWKTSSIYTGKKIDKEKGQLVLYAESLIQLGVPIENIKIQWCFLKYVTVEIQQANGKTVNRNIARNEIGESLKSNVKMWLTKCKRYTDDEIESFLDIMCLTNNINELPDDIKEKYVIRDCFVNIPFSKIEIEELKDDILNTIAEISKKEIEYTKNKNENIWWEEVSDEKSYYFANLSGYSANLHKPYKEYLDKFELFKSNQNNANITEDDMEWLNEI
jgi:hypothetical protein